MKRKNERWPMKYRLLDNKTMNILIQFMGDIQLQAAEEDDYLLMEFCTDLLKELVNSSEVIDTGDERIKKYYKKDDFTPDDFFTNRDQIEKLYRYFSDLEKQTNNKSKNKKSKDNKEFKRPHIEDIAEHCTLEEIKEFLLDDPELTDDERFELYYEEHRRVQRQKEKKKNKGVSYNKMLKDLGISPPDK